MVEMPYVAEAGETLTLLVLAAALGMDAFSVGLGIGMRGIRLRDIMKISIIVGLFHVLMPLFGMVAGRYLGQLLGDIAVLTGGGLLTLLGLHMIYSALRGEGTQSFDHRSWVGMLVFSLGVSIDSFSVGVSLGIFSTNMLVTVTLFGLFGGGMSVLGLWLGRKVNSWMGDYGEAFGGAILLALGMKFIL
ncbi:manganese efflux pump MntP [Marinicrinis sediminis]|uniref:Putative manganese efflux pump MntP n=1 Tax=Marinicrinis sediminis TaxID=1652465 RepID=A0ABW5RBJ0_9BACL